MTVITADRIAKAAKREFDNNAGLAEYLCFGTSVSRSARGWGTIQILRLPISAELAQKNGDDHEQRPESDQDCDAVRSFIYAVTLTGLESRPSGEWTALLRRPLVLARLRLHRTDNGA